MFSRASYTRKSTSGAMEIEKQEGMRRLVRVLSPVIWFPIYNIFGSLV
jgi:hypothetical protein